MKRQTRLPMLLLALTFLALSFANAADGTATSSGVPSDVSLAHEHFDGWEVGPVSGWLPMTQVVPNDPSGKQGAGGRAVAHRHGARPISDPAIRRRSPDARLFSVGGERGLEPTLAVNRDGTIFYVAQRYFLNGLRSAIMRSRDGARTWENVAPTTHTRTEDPYLWLDKRTGRLFDVDLTAPVLYTWSGLQVSSSDDEGDSWTSSKIPLGWHTDHQNLFAGPPPEGDPPSDYPHVVYVCSIGGGAYAGTGTATTCSRSLDGGIIFSPTGEAAFADGDNDDIGHFGIRGHCGGETGHGFVDRRGWI